MRSHVVVASVLLVAFLCFAEVGAYNYNAYNNTSPIWKVFCEFVYHGRVDSLVNPGTYSGHVHKVFGGSHFSASKPSRSPMENYYVTRNSGCTSCTIAVADNSNYWTPDLYYQWPNGSFSLVPSSGLTVYYLSRPGFTGENATNPNWQPFPKGLRMLAGDTNRRTYNVSLSADKAIDYVCLTNNNNPPAQIGGFQTKDNYCFNGMRAQIFFPMCWDGVNLDSPDHKSHMSYPLHSTNNPELGDCPGTHPVRIPGLFYEHFYTVAQFPHGDGTRQPFVWSNGDPTGYGFHGDFVSGWIPEIMAAAIKHPNCSNENPLMGAGNIVSACPPLAPYLKADPSPRCNLDSPMPTAEDLGASQPLTKLPGCNPITPGPAYATQCSANLQASENSRIFTIKSKSLGTYITYDKDSLYLYSNYTGVITFQQYWGINWWQASRTGAPAGWATIQSQEEMIFVSAQTSAKLQMVTDAWEFWQPVQMGQYWAFKSNRNQMWLSVNTPGNLVSFYASTVGDSELFILTPSTGGSVTIEDGFDSIAALGNADMIDLTKQINIQVLVKKSMGSFDSYDFVYKVATLLAISPYRVKMTNKVDMGASGVSVTLAFTDMLGDATTAFSVTNTFRQLMSGSQGVIAFNSIGYPLDASVFTVTNTQISGVTNPPTTTAKPVTYTTANGTYVNNTYYGTTMAFNSTLNCTGRVNCTYLSSADRVGLAIFAFAFVLIANLL